MSMQMTKLAAGGGLAIMGGLNNLSISLFNVPITVVFMAAAGALLSFAYNVDGDDKMPRRKLFVLVLANTMLACAAVAVLPQWLGWSWNSPKIEGSLALLFAAIARFAVPWGLKVMPELAKEILSKWFRLGEYKQEARKDNDP